MRLLFLSLLLLLGGVARATSPETLPPLPPDEAVRGRDWLVDTIEVGAQVYRTEHPDEIALSNGLLRRTFRLAPNAATVGLRQLVTGESILRAVKPEAVVSLNGTRIEVGGLKGQPNNAFLLENWIDTLSAAPEAMQFTGFEAGEPAERMAWKRVRSHAPDSVWPPRGARLRLDFAMPATAPEALRSVRVSVHYELYDGIPAYAKWISITNDTSAPVRLDTFTSEVLGVVEYGSHVDAKPEFFSAPNVHVETDFAFAGMGALDSSRHSVHWVADPEYTTQVNYRLETPCLLEVRPLLGPAVDIAPGETFESFRAFVLARDSYDRERNGLAQRRLYRHVAPWVTENPLMLHVRHASGPAVREALDQCAEVGFEMAILTFGSSFNLENTKESYLEFNKELADYAAAKGVELGGYSLLASRKISPEDDVVMPEGQKPTFDQSPCLGSRWGQNYFNTLYHFFEATGFDLLEHDGSYPGDPCTSTTHPAHRAYDDSQWNQWQTIRQFYRWCRERGIFLNVPDFYVLAGSNKTGMGYRETNWSLPRAQQVIHTRQNIFDGTWEKTPSMGWMFVPLTEYHGGGEAATIEPLDEHLDHYERMLISNLALGVQACYRGPRLYDTPRTRDMVKRWVDWYKRYRGILESDLIHGRRADGQDVDWMLHANPRLPEKGMLVAFNPLDTPVRRTLQVNLYYTGLKDVATLAPEGANPASVRLARDYTVPVELEIPAQGFRWVLIQ